MRSIKVLFTLLVGTAAAAMYACGSSHATNNGDAGTSSRSGAESGATGSSSGAGNGIGSSSGADDGGGGAASSSSGSGGGAASSSSSSGSGSGAASSSSGADAAGDEGGNATGDDSGDDGGNSTAVEGNCPDTCPGAAQNCCLVNMGGAVWGVCATQSDCMAQGGGFLACGSPDDCGGAASATPACCLLGADAGALPSTACMASCAAGSAPACNVDETTCPNGGAGYDCSPISDSIPIDAIGACTPNATSGAGDDSSSAE